jgi:condensin complex subunit 3
MPEKVDGVHAQVLQALEESQRSFAGHRKCIIRLKQAQEADAEAFRATLDASIDRALLIFRREPSVERMLALVAALVSFSNDKYQTDSELAVHLLERMVPLTAARDKAVRFRACQLTAKLLNSLGEDAEVSEELYEKVLKAMLERLNDKVPVVRVHAVAAVARLQDPTDASDPVTAEYIRLVSSDTSKEVRKAVMANMGVSTLTLPQILERLRDVKDDVRKYTYSVVAIKIDVKALQITQRVMLLGGLQDRCEAVRKACIHMMVSKWLPRCDNNPIKLLKLLDVEIHPEPAERALRAILGEGGIKKSASADFLPVSAGKKKPGDALTSEEAFYWRVLGKVATERNDDELMEAALPEIPAIYEILTGNLSKAFVTGELMQIVPLLDFGDELGRKRLYSMLGVLLLDYKHTPPTLVPHIMAALSAMESSAEFVAFVGGVMQQVQVSGEEHEEAEGVPSEGSQCWRQHVLSLGCALLRMVSRFSEIAPLSDYIKNTAERLVQHPSETIRHASIQCLGLFALLDEHVAGSYMPLFVKVLKHDCDNLKVTALSAIMDALLVFRQSSWNAVPAQLNAAYTLPYEVEDKTDAENNSGDAGNDTSSVWNLVFSCLHHASCGVRSVAAEGLAKLVLGGRIVSSKVEQQLLLALTLLYFSPLSEPDVQLRQCLAIFFPAFAAKEHANAMTLAHLTLPALKHIAAAPKSSPLAKASALQVRGTEHVPACLAACRHVWWWA